MYQYWLNQTFPVPREEDIIWQWNGYDLSQFESMPQYWHDEEYGGAFSSSFSMSLAQTESSYSENRDFCIKVEITNSFGMKLWELAKITGSSRCYIRMDLTSGTIGMDSQNFKKVVVGVHNGSSSVDGNGLLFHFNPQVSSQHGMLQIATGSISTRRRSGDSSAPGIDFRTQLNLFVTKRPNAESPHYRMYYLGNGVSQGYTNHSYSVPTIWESGSSNSDMSSVVFGVNLSGSGLQFCTFYIKSIYVCKHPFDIT